MKHGYIILAILVWNVIVFFMYGLDKLKAKKDKWRIPEKTLLLSAFLLGGIGAFAGMKVFRHKTKHRSFSILVPVFAVLCIAACIYLLTGCGRQNAGLQKEDNVNVEYKQITQEEAKRIMDEESGFVILDVREQDEFDAGHIPGAVLLPYTKTEELAGELLKDKDQQILVYCRSGRRSKIAAESLSDMGYTDVKEFGGIIDWPYETE